VSNPPKITPGSGSLTAIVRCINTAEVRLAALRRDSRPAIPENPIETVGEVIADAERALEDAKRLIGDAANTHAEDQSRNGVRVIVTRHKDGTTVDASCSCFGIPGRTHSSTSCPRIGAKS
jgi:hypothetical protein